VKKAYADFHDKGLEILGVSNDYSADELKSFIAKDPQMPWPQLFDAQAAGKQEWNPITTGFGIDGIPTMFLIDKKGVVRSVTARENFEEMIPKLLAESK
jgi:peroxiredoxin